MERDRSVIKVTERKENTSLCKGVCLIHPRETTNDPSHTLCEEITRHLGILLLAMWEDILGILLLPLDHRGGLVKVKCLFSHRDIV